MSACVLCNDVPREICTSCHRCPQCGHKLQCEGAYVITDDYKTSTQHKEVDYR